MLKLSRPTSGAAIARPWCDGTDSIANKIIHVGWPDARVIIDLFRVAFLIGYRTYPTRKASRLAGFG